MKVTCLFCHVSTRGILCQPADERSNRISNWNSLVLENVRSSNIETINFVLIFIPNIDPETFSLNLFSNRSRKTKKNESDGISFERDFN